MPILERLDRLPAALLMPLALVVHLLLDWATFIAPFSPLGITPWNPTTGLVFGLALAKGLPYAVLFAAGPLASDLLVRPIELPVATLLVEVALTGLCYTAGLMLLRSLNPPFDARLSSARDLLLLGGVATATAALVAALYVGVLVAAGLLAPAGFVTSALRYWIGESIGILVMTPFVLLLLARQQRPRWTLEATMQVIAILASIAVVLGLGGRYQTQLFYVLFLPIVWVGVRNGLAGVAAALVLLQVGIMVSLHIGRHDAVDVAEFQAVMLILVCAGLTVGMLVRERQAGELRLRQLQDSIARAVRLASVDRFSSATAHEINQPLTAIANYSRTAVLALGREPADLPVAREAATKALEQVTRAAEVVRRLRNLISLGRAELSRHRLGPIIEESLALVRPDLVREGVRVEVRLAPAADVLVDVLQVEQVLTNLFRNALDAMRPLPPATRTLTIVAQPDGAGYVRVDVADSGPGFPEGFRLVPELPSPTSKKDGLGIGLALSAAVIEAHGGTLTVSAAGSPALVSFTLRAASGGADGSDG